LKVRASEVRIDEVRVFEIAFLALLRLEQLVDVSRVERREPARMKAECDDAGDQREPKPIDMSFHATLSTIRSTPASRFGRLRHIITRRTSSAAMMPDLLGRDDAGDLRMCRHQA
jgi:hypothetical protein